STRYAATQRARVEKSKSFACRRRHARARSAAASRRPGRSRAAGAPRAGGRAARRAQRRRAGGAAAAARKSGARLAVSVNSFSYKRGLPRGVDMVLDCRFLRNPYWEPALRSFDGTSVEVAAYVAEDERFQPFFDKTLEMAELLLPAYLEEGKAHFALGFGCTGGQHRSVAIAEKMSQALAERGWQVSTRHRELERADQPKRSAKAADQG
ncbi:MAG: RNase adapter RapZ, partial [Pseudomonadota bacterium]|nr:RNase adapter RapZ [Pseudomonadota bacterium]